MSIAETSGEHCYEAELYRLKGNILSGGFNNEDGVTPSSDEAAHCFHNAIALARQHGARSLELRAVSGLARLWQRQGRTADARQVLSEVYGRFTEGLDTADLRDAKALLDVLAAGNG
jgi:adenylate cyclase